MKRLLMMGVLAIAVMFTACEQNSDVNAPIGTNQDDAVALMKNLDNIDLTTSEIEAAEEMFYLEEDMSLLFDAGELQSFNTLVNGLLDPRGMGNGHGRLHPHRPGIHVDMAALTYYRLIVRACPDIDPGTKQAIRELIAESHKNRIEIIKNNTSTDPATLAELLRGEHEVLMLGINNLLDPACLTAVEQLKEELRQKREEHRQKLLERRIEREVAFLTKLLNLDQSQVDAVKAIIARMHEDIAELREQYQGDPEGFREALQALRESIDNEIAALLDAEQLEIWNNFKDRRPDGKPDPLTQHINMLTKALDLTAQQAEELTAIFERQKAAEKDLFAQYSGDRAALMAALKQLHQDILDEIEALLSAEQFEKYMKITHRGRRHG